MKNCLAISLVFFATFTLNAQSIERQVIGSVGGSFNGTVQIDWTVGEVAVATATSGSVILTQGFQQPPPIPNAVKTVNQLKGVSAFPNPTIGEVKLRAMGLTGNAIIQVHDATGKLIYSSTWNTLTESNINLSNNASGLYTVSVVKNTKTAVFRVARL